MVKMKMMQYLPLMATAESAFQQGDKALAVVKIKEFANKMSSFYSEGDSSYDALRTAFIGVSKAALILGQVDDSDAVSYAKKAIDFAYKVYNEKHIPNNGLAIVSTTATYLKIVLTQDLTSLEPMSYIDDVRSTAREFVERLKKHFPGDPEVAQVVNDYDNVDSHFGN